MPELDKNISRSSMTGMVILGFLHLIFLWAIISSHWHEPLIVSIVVASAALVYWAYAYSKIINHQRSALNFYHAAGLLVGALLCYFLNVHLGLGSVIAVGLVGLLGSYTNTIFRHYSFSTGLPAALYCGAFIGMCSDAVAGGYLFIILGSLASFILLSYSQDVLNGYGGKLGTIAFGGVFIISLLKNLFF
jgi:hypothetical protein